MCRDFYNTQLLPTLGTKVTTNFPPTHLGHEDDY